MFRLKYKLWRKNINVGENSVLPQYRNIILTEIGIRIEKEVVIILNINNNFNKINKKCSYKY